MGPQTHRVLVVDDEELIRKLLARGLADEPGCDVVVAADLAAARPLVEREEFDLLIVDKNLPDGSGLELIGAIRGLGHQSEVIVITGYSDVASAIQAVALGVSRYARKPIDLESLRVDVAQVLEKVGLRRDLERRTRDLERALARSEKNGQLYRLLFDGTNDAMMLFPIDDEGAPQPLSEVNQRAVELLGFSREELKSKTIRDLNTDRSLESLPLRMDRLMEEGRLVADVELRTRDGQPLPAEVSSRIVDMDGGRMALAVVRDVTHRAGANEDGGFGPLDQQMREAQKLEALGRLAGGVAHDMNNLLGAIMGFAGVLEGELDRGDPRLRDLQGILAACRRGRTLTRDLLGFARQGRYVEIVLSPNDLVLEVARVLERTVAKRIEIVCEPSPGTPNILGDPTQLHHALINICLNGVDAMPNGGKLSLGTRLERFEDPSAEETKAGRHAAIVISDEGIGMDERTLRQAVEPFFTTKPRGEGTGLGLSMAFGVAQAHGGRIQIESEPGRGTTVELLLPAVEGQATQLYRPQVPSKAPRAKDRLVLLADDEPLVRAAGKRLLEKIGYRVVMAENGEQAVELFKTYRSEVSFILLDLVMPVLDGQEAFARIRELDPLVPVLLASGYTSDSGAQELLGEPRVSFLQKPYELGALVDEIARLVG